MANHGVVSYGKTLLEAFLRMETVEHLAHIYLTTQQLGSAQPLQANQIEQLRRAKKKYVQNSIEVINAERPVGPGRLLNESNANGHVRTKEEIRVFSSKTNRYN